MSRGYVPFFGLARMLVLEALKGEAKCQAERAIKEASNQCLPGLRVALHQGSVVNLDNTSQVGARQQEHIAVGRGKSQVDLCPQHPVTLIKLADFSCLIRRLWEMGGSTVR